MRKTKSISPRTLAAPRRLGGTIVLLGRSGVGDEISKAGGQFKKCLLNSPNLLWIPYNTFMTTIFNRGKLPAGTYYVGDLCYVINDDDWSDFCDRSFPDSNTEIIGIFETYEGINYANFGTKYGDGEYTDYHGRRYAVDSGSIGCIPVCALGENHNLEKVKGLGNIISFDEPFDIYYEESTGTIQFGEVEIMTGDYEEYEDEDEDEYYLEDEEDAE